MINVSDEKRYAFTVWLRTGRLRPEHRADGLEFKFNPYHDPRDGRFTFAPGGPGAQAELGSSYAGSQSRRAVMVARLKGYYEPLQVETLRFVQQRADDAYDRGMAILKAGRLR